MAGMEIKDALTCKGLANGRQSTSELKALVIIYCFTYVTVVCRTPSLHLVLLLCAAVPSEVNQT